MKVKGFGRREFLEADVISVYLWVIAMIADILIGVGSSKTMFSLIKVNSFVDFKDKGEFFEGRDE